MRAAGPFHRPAQGRIATVLLTAAFLLGARPAASAIHVVTDLGDDGAGDELRVLIADAGPGDTVIVPAGTIALSAGELALLEDITLLGAGSELTTIQAGPGGRVFKVGSTTVAPVVVIVGMTVTGGSPTGSGGGIDSFGDVSLIDVVIEGCQADAGGGISNRPGAVMHLQSVTVRGNSTRANTTPLGGGILNGGTMTILDSTISGNSTTTVGNLGSSSGGGVLNGGSLTVRNSTISGNTAGGNVGGGIHHTPYAPGLTLTHVTVTDNSSGGDGGGLSLQGGAVTVVNSIIAGNRVPRGMGGPDCSAGLAALLTFDYNLVGNTRYCTLPAGAAGNILDRPARLQALGDNGGPTETHALLPSSPAIDAGSNASCVPTDQRGQPRPVDANRHGVATCDMGSYERVP